MGPLDITVQQRRCILAGIWAATFLVAAPIAAEFQESNHAGWIGTSYLLATCTFAPLYGRLCSLLGRRKANQTAVALAAMGALCSGLARDMKMLAAARFLNGLGGGGVFITATIITSDMYSPRERCLTQGYASVFNNVGLGMGGPLGGWISDRFGWRWAFFFQVPLFIISFILTGRNLHYVTPGETNHSRDTLSRIDYGGILCFFGFLACFISLLHYKYNNNMPWIDPIILSLCILTPVLFVSFFMVELFLATEPVLAPSLLSQRVPILIGLSYLFVGLCNFCVNYFFPLFFQTVLLSSSARAGFHLLPNAIALSSGSVFAGWILRKTGRYKQLINIFGIFPFFALLSMTQLSKESSPFWQWICIVPLGFGNAVLMQTTYIALVGHIEASMIPIALGFAQLWRGLGQICGVAVSSAVFQSSLLLQLTRRLRGADAPGVIEQIRRSASMVGHLPPDIRGLAQDAFAASLQRVFILATCVSGLGYLVRLMVPSLSMSL
ncbi:hypothetical protein M422DRAFT_61856 [Sphaerobolus stellatus SS14]|uniref:Unplaced genomic scaffold SPHSTscaffold_212, whole genome shotgun sequence n=1 Tax=Sphaerobolus stellatus (strain SS14) TaxID=990650 RepID=A0A0C9TI78_SPHS4|nr:hypothetical protein M422DRAFT_61856 [Sphaerobolus stellatus SS14]